MGNQQGFPTHKSNSTASSHPSGSSSENDVSRRSQFQKRHTVVIPTITTTNVDENAHVRPRRASEGVTSVRLPFHRDGDSTYKQPSPLHEVDELEGNRGRRKSGSEASPNESPPATSNLQAAERPPKGADVQELQAHHNTNRRVSVENVKDALKDAFSKSPLLARKLFRGHGDMNLFHGRRSRRSSETDPGPLFNVTGPPSVPSEEIYKSGLDPDEDLAPQPRMRARTIGSGHTAANFRHHNSLVENAAINAREAARKRRIGIPAVPSNSISTVFKYPAAGITGSDPKVYLFGTMTNWKCVEMTRQKGEEFFLRILECPEGRTFYKFNVDGVWKHDPAQNMKKDEVSGKIWNEIHVQRTDSDVFEALACDSFSLRDRRYDTGKTNDTDRLVEEDWTQEKPSVTFLNSPRHKGPPLLPPHLLQVLLNKEYSETNDPVLLPEPSYVTLDHLYAQSIRDNMLVLSTTYRYKKKFVTMVMYRPI